jgi:hypothetical protein
MPTVKQYQFGSGALFLTRTDIANPTARRIGVLQEISLEAKFENKSLRGEFRFPVDISQGPASITGKFKQGQINGRIWADLLGATPSTALKTPVIDEAGAIPGSSTYTVTVAGAAIFYEDLGVTLAATGQTMERVASSPAAGQYSVSAGVYTFAAANASAAVLISYNTTVASPVAPNTLFTLTNTVMGSAPAFSLNLCTVTKGKSLWSKLHAVSISGLTMPLKMDDYMLPETSFEAFADDSGNVMSWASAG